MLWNEDPLTGPAKGRTMDNGDKYALQRQQMLQREALELRLVPVQSGRKHDERKRPSLHTVRGALAALDAGRVKPR
jgi:hypothetical protein